jgi:hypothetical protein
MYAWSRDPELMAQRIEKAKFRARMNKEEWLYYALARKDRHQARQELVELFTNDPTVPKDQQVVSKVGSTNMIVDQSAKSHLHVMARYHVWATKLLVQEVSSLSDDEFKRDLGLFFGSIHGTLVHLLAADRLWLTRMHRGLEADGAWAAPLWADEAKGSTLEKFMPDRAEVINELLKGAQVSDEMTVQSALC